MFAASAICSAVTALKPRSTNKASATRWIANVVAIAPAPRCPLGRTTGETVVRVTHCVRADVSLCQFRRHASRVVSADGLPALNMSLFYVPAEHGGHERFRGPL